MLLASVAAGAACFFSAERHAAMPRHVCRYIAAAAAAALRCCSADYAIAADAYAIHAAYAYFHYHASYATAPLLLYHAALFTPHATLRY